MRRFGFVVLVLVLVVGKFTTVLHDTEAASEAPAVSADQTSDSTPVAAVFDLCCR